MVSWYLGEGEQKQGVANEKELEKDGYCVLFSPSQNKGDNETDKNEYREKPKCKHGKGCVSGVGELNVL